MSPFIVSFLVAVGAGAWIYTKFQRSSGNNTQQSAKAAGVAALIIFIIFYFVTQSLLK
jgi:hypothetical protein